MSKGVKHNKKTVELDELSELTGQAEVSAPCPHWTRYKKCDDPPKSTENKDSMRKWELRNTRVCSSLFARDNDWSMRLFWRWKLCRFFGFSGEFFGDFWDKWEEIAEMCNDRGQYLLKFDRIHDLWLFYRRLYFDMIHEITKMLLRIFLIICWKWKILFWRVHGDCKIRIEAILSRLISVWYFS